MRAVTSLLVPSQPQSASGGGIPGIQGWAEIIEAVQTPLGLIVLLVLVVGTAAFAFFGKEASTRVRLAVFTSLWLGAAGIILVTADTDRREPEANPVRCLNLDEAAFAEVRRATGLDREAIARGDYETSELAGLEYQAVLLNELERKGYSSAKLSDLTLREPVLRAREECIIP